MAPEVIKSGEELKKYKKSLADYKNKRIRKKPQPPATDKYGYGTECDIWSAGILLYALVYGQLPFRGVTVKEIKTKVMNSKKEIKYKDGVSEECQDLIKKMLDRDQKRRYTVEQVLEHRWLQSCPE